jgi:hypothetical protein
VKQTILDNYNNIEHYRVYSYDAMEENGVASIHSNGWSKWFSNLPWPRNNIAASDYWKLNDNETFPVLGLDYAHNTSTTGLSQSDTCTIDAKDLINYWTGKYADLHLLARDSNGYTDGNILSYDGINHIVKDAGFSKTDFDKKLSIPPKTPAYSVIPVIDANGSKEFMYIDFVLGAVSSVGDSRALATYTAGSGTRNFGSSPRYLWTSTPT